MRRPWRRQRFVAWLRRRYPAPPVRISFHDRCDTVHAMEGGSVIPFGFAAYWANQREIDVATRLMYGPNSDEVLVSVAHEWRHHMQYSQKRDTRSRRADEEAERWARARVQEWVKEE